MNNNQLKATKEFTYQKQFATDEDGLPISNPMWRDGYNKALEDVRNFIDSIDQEY